MPAGSKKGGGLKVKRNIALVIKRKLKKTKK